MSAPVTDEMIEVRLLDVPIPLRERSTQHSDELLREMTLIAHQAEGGGDLPTRLVQLSAEVRATYREFTMNASAEMDVAAQAGVDSLDVTYHVPRSVGAFCRRILEVIDEAEAYCRQGEHLLTLAAPPEVLAYQRWIVGEFIRQADGEPPTPWRDVAARGRDGGAGAADQTENSLNHFDER
jgi:hypothetical protein